MDHADRVIELTVGKFSIIQEVQNQYAWMYRPQTTYRKSLDYN